MKHGREKDHGKGSEKNKKSKGPFGAILRLFKNAFSTSGEFSVTGENSVSFEVKCNHEKHILVCFADPEPTPIPCVPFTPDFLTVEFAQQQGPFSLVTISWKVSGVRTIAWRVNS
jgi:hypothetical protein